MGKNEPIETLEKMRNELINAGLQFKKNKIAKNGELSANDLNAFSNVMRSSAYVEQIRYQQEKGLEVKVEQIEEAELSKADRARLDKIAKLLSGEEPPKKRGKK